MNHFYTISKDEYDFLKAYGFHDEGIECYVWPVDYNGPTVVHVSDSIPLYMVGVLLILAVLNVICFGVWFCRRKRIKHDYKAVHMDSCDEEMTDIERI